MSTIIESKEKEKPFVIEFSEVEHEMLYGEWVAMFFEVFVILMERSIRYNRMYNDDQILIYTWFNVTVATFSFPFLFLLF